MRDRRQRFHDVIRSHCRIRLSRLLRPLRTECVALVTPSIESIQSSVARHFGVDRRVFRVTSRDLAQTRIRHIAMYLSRSLNRSSYPAIAAAFGKLDHTTVIFACRKIEKRIPDDADLVADIYAIQARVKESFVKSNPTALIDHCPHCHQFWVDPERKRQMVTELKRQFDELKSRIETMEQVA
jgi:hypothetical protein